MRKFNSMFLIATAFAVSGAALAQAAATAPKSTAMTEAQVRALLAAEGFTRIDDLDFEDGAWETDATSADGNRVDVRIDPVTGKVFADTVVSALSEDDIKAKLSAAGYSRIHDVDFDDGVWKAEADNAEGNDVELHLDPQDGRIMHVEND